MALVPEVWEDVPMKQWPEDKTKTVSFEELVAPLAEILRSGKLPDDFSEVFNIGANEQTCSLPPDQTLKIMDYHKEQGRDLFDVVLGIAVQYGIEQGRRMMQKELNLWQRIGTANNQ